MPTTQKIYVEIWSLKGKKHVYNENKEYKNPAFVFCLSESKFYRYNEENKYRLVFTWQRKQNKSTAGKP